MGSNSVLIRSKIDLTNNSRIEASSTMWEHAELKKMIPWILKRAYTVASASVPLMEFAMQQCEQGAAADPVAARFKTYLRAHIAEEIGHDEQCLDDLEALGVRREDVLSQYPYPSIVSMLGMQYYWIRHRHPIGFAGYLAIIEGHPASAERIRRVQRDTGLPENAFRTLLWHADHDGDHTRELDELIDDIPLTDEQLSLIGVNIANTNSLLAKSVHEMIAAFESQTRARTTRMASSA